MGHAMHMIGMVGVLELACGNEGVRLIVASFTSVENGTPLDQAV